MKKSLFVLLTVILIPQAAGAQQQTLIKGKIESGFFGAPVVKFSQVKSEFAVFAGGRGGWIINHVFSLGLGGYGLANDIQIEGIGLGFGRDIEFGYGGLELEYINSSSKVLHFTLYGLLGGGGVTLPATVPELDDAVFVAEPKANLVLNVASAMRIGVGAGYRWVTGTNSRYYGSGDLSAAMIDLTLFFGKF
jgi:hypothetical protein